MSHVIAHRGASADRPENTVDAFVEAARQGADGVELDVRPSLDRRLLVAHDAHLPDGRAVSETRQADVPASVCDLAAALAACGSMWVNVEIKNLPGEPGHDATGWLVDATLAVIAEVSPPGGVRISSFDAATLDAVRRHPAAPPTGLLVLSADEPADMVLAAADAGHEALHPWDPTVDAGLVERAQRAGLEVAVWTVDDPSRARQLSGWGVDAVITNRPGEIRAALGAGAESAELDGRAE